MTLCMRTSVRCSHNHTNFLKIPTVATADKLLPWGHPEEPLLAIHGQIRWVFRRLASASHEHLPRPSAGAPAADRENPSSCSSLAGPEPRVDKASISKRRSHRQRNAVIYDRDLLRSAVYYPTRSTCDCNSINFLAFHRGGPCRLRVRAPCRGGHGGQHGRHITAQLEESPLCSSDAASIINPSLLCCKKIIEAGKRPELPESLFVYCSHPSSEKSTSAALSSPARRTKR